MENIRVEFTSVLWKKVRTKEISSEKAMATGLSILKGNIY